MRGLAAGFDRATTHVAWTPDSRCTAVHRRRSRPARRVAAARFERGGGRRRWPLPLVVQGGTVGGFAQSRDGAVLAFDRPSVSSPPALFACHADGTGERAIESVNRSLLARHVLGEMREFTVKGWNKEPVQVYAIYPPNFDPSASGRCCTRSTAVRTPRTWTSGISAGIRRCSPATAMSSRRQLSWLVGLRPRRWTRSP